MVLTSVIVHGITIPLGKSMQHTLTLTRTKSSSGRAGQIVSRLPPPVPFGGALPTSDAVAAPDAKEVGAANVNAPGTAQNSRSGTPIGFSRTNTVSQGIRWGGSTVGHSVVSSGRTSPSNDNDTAATAPAPANQTQHHILPSTHHLLQEGDIAEMVNPHANHHKLPLTHAMVQDP